MIAEKLERAVRTDPVIQLNRYVWRLEDALEKAIHVMTSVDPLEGDNWKQYRDAIDEARLALGRPAGLAEKQSGNAE